MEPVRFALEYYRRLNEAAKDERHHRKSIVDLGESAISTTSGSGSSAVTKSISSHSMRSKRSGGTIHSRSRSTDEDQENLTIEEIDNPESSDPETATEVEISEKTLKFKISTEGSVATSSGSGRKSYPGSRKGSKEKSSFDHYNHDLAKAVREHDRERRRSRGENLSSDMSSPVSARSGDDGRMILEELESDAGEFFESAYRDERTVEGNGNVIAIESLTFENRKRPKKRPSVAENDIGEVYSVRKDSALPLNNNLWCCCDDKTASNNQKSLLSRLRNFTDRLSISFDSKEPSIAKTTKYYGTPTRALMMIESSSASAMAPRQNSTVTLCKRCNLMKKLKESKESSQNTVVEIIGTEKRAMTLPKVRKSQDGKNRSWKMVFAKEKRPSASMEILPGHKANPSAVKHQRNLSNPEGKINVQKTTCSKGAKSVEKILKFNDFKEIDVRTSNKPEIIIHPGSSTINDGDIGKVEIRRSSASMEDISKITKLNEGVLIGTLDDKKQDELQHTGSLDSILYKESAKSEKKPFPFSSPYIAKKSSPGLFSRFKSGMSIDGTRSASNSGSSLHDQTQQQQTGWISSLAASFRPKRHPGELQSNVSHAIPTPGHDGVK